MISYIDALHEKIEAHLIPSKRTRPGDQEWLAGCGIHDLSKCVGCRERR